ncbi:hypothetical protein GGI20_004051 [Coemansia sp. BCRC 34301]|nr:hypothetical protein GGI20_004051 [Coemansia sp. BCRC 34301]
MPKQPATTTRSLKAFVRVSKNSEPANLKANGKPSVIATARPMTRSRSRIDEKDSVPVPPSLPVLPPRKRKLAKLPADPPAQKKEKKTPTTISAYFSPSANKMKKAAASETTAEATAESIPETVADKVAESVPETVAEKVVESVPETVVEKAVKSAPETVVEPAPLATVANGAHTPSRVLLKGRAAELLTRLRNRHNTTTTTTTASETLSIKEDLRARRNATALSLPSPTLASSESFAESGTLSPETEHTRSVHRQFVAIRTPAQLPQQLRKLHEIFQALDHTVMFGGQRSVIYHRARRGVESMAKRTFGWRELGQILALYPESYAYQSVSTLHDGRQVPSVELTPKVKGMQLAVEIEARRNEFAARLSARVDAAHRAFLVKRSYTDAEIDALQGACHPSFDIEETPHVTPLPMPPTPVATAAGPVATFDRDRLRHLLGANESEKPPTVLALPPTPVSSPVLAPATAPATTPTRPPVGTAKNLLERIREKQRAREAAQLAAADAVPLATRTMHSRLPAILETLSFLFYTERRNVLPYFYVVDKLAEAKGLERSDTSAHIVALAGFVPEWCSISDPLEQAEPSPDARLAITRSISMQEAKSRLVSKIADAAAAAAA